MSAPVFLADPAGWPGTGQVTSTGSKAPRRGMPASCSAAAGRGRRRRPTAPGAAAVRDLLGRARVLELEVAERVVEPAVAGVRGAVQALAKGDRDELAIEAATEVGVDGIVPWQAQRSVVVWRGERAAAAGPSGSPPSARRPSSRAGRGSRTWRRRDHRRAGRPRRVDRRARWRCARAARVREARRSATLRCPTRARCSSWSAPRGASRTLSSRPGGRRGAGWSARAARAADVGGRAGGRGAGLRAAGSLAGAGGRPRAGAARLAWSHVVDRPAERT